MSEDATQVMSWADVKACLVEIRVIARRQLALEKDRHSWQTTALLDEALERLYAKDGRWIDRTWPNRRYFFSACRRAMRRALVDHARARHAAQRKLPGGLISLDSIESDDLEGMIVDSGPSRGVDERRAPSDALSRSLGLLQGARDRHADLAEIIDTLQDIYIRRPEEVVERDPDVAEALHGAIEDLDRAHPNRPELAEMLEMRFVLWLSLPEAAAVMGYSERHGRRLFAEAVHALQAIVAVSRN